MDRNINNKKNILIIIIISVLYISIGYSLLRQNITTTGTTINPYIIDWFTNYFLKYLLELLQLKK